MSPKKHMGKKETQISNSDKHAPNPLLGTGCSQALGNSASLIEQPQLASGRHLQWEHSVDLLGADRSSLNSHIKYQMSVLGWEDGPMGKAPAAQAPEPK